MRPSTRFWLGFVVLRVRRHQRERVGPRFTLSLPNDGPACTKALSNGPATTEYAETHFWILFDQRFVTSKRGMSVQCEGKEADPDFGKSQARKRRKMLERTRTGLRSCQASSSGQS
jgi:hypothetical protein